MHCVSKKVNNCPHSSRPCIPIPCCISQRRCKLENCALSILVLQPVECGSAIINLNRTNQTLCKERKLNTFIKAIGSCVLLALLPCCCKLDIKDLANTKPLNTNATLNRVHTTLQIFTVNYNVNTTL